VSPFPEAKKTPLRSAEDTWTHGLAVSRLDGNLAKVSSTPGMPSQSWISLKPGM
jgi:hypothetical protein